MVPVRQKTPRGVPDVLLVASTMTEHFLNPLNLCTQEQKKTPLFVIHFLIPGIYGGSNEQHDGVQRGDRTHSSTLGHSSVRD